MCAFAPLESAQVDLLDEASLSACESCRDLGLDSRQAPELNSNSPGRPGGLSVLSVLSGCICGRFCCDRSPNPRPSPARQTLQDLTRPSTRLLEDSCCRLGGRRGSCQVLSGGLSGGNSSTRRDPEEPTDKTDKPPGRPGEFEFQGLLTDLPAMRAKFFLSPGSGKKLSVLSVLSVGSSGSLWVLELPKSTQQAT